MAIVFTIEYSNNGWPLTRFIDTSVAPMLSIRPSNPELARTSMEKSPEPGPSRSRQSLEGTLVRSRILPSFDIEPPMELVRPVMMKKLKENMVVVGEILPSEFLESLADGIIGNRKEEKDDEQ